MLSQNLSQLSSCKIPHCSLPQEYIVSEEFNELEELEELEELSALVHLEETGVLLIKIPCSYMNT